MAERLGFVGLGIMGSGMARNLVRAGFEVTVWNRTRSRMNPLVDIGAQPAPDLPRLAAATDVIFVCVSDTPDVEDVLLGQDGLIAGAGPGSLVIDTSTISPSRTKEMAAELSERGIAMLDAPISGGSEGAADGTLSIMVGGREEDLERARPYLEAVGSSITHIGRSGAGQAAKLVNQVLVVVNMLGVAEALVFATAQELDMRQTLKAVSGGAAGSWMLSNRGPQVLARDWRPGFTIDLQQKDLRLALDEAAEQGAPLVATAIVEQFYRTLQADDLGGEGNHALVKAVERLADLVVAGE